ncbi:hypothetical protein [Nitrosomonas oligotropha]|uniref:Uncharacterized protein n=1 Tax=Nitrosomonas oligotropha TaxID=42354 RepID=A0A1H8KBB3_9PROT|nr:hypothetical protein [Nitrosomonas oligotropha]SDW29725.1 hypothetical protein SAMN05216300_10370 [Nitrosomonas oligotropha]SEN90309.1 hypothetical protein SAMN05216333_10270 [Nitrosomonas oligotropha]
MKSKEALQHLKQHESQLLAIHYSCQSLGDGNEGLSPRITSIAVLHLASSSMHSFSIHLIAEVRNVKREEIHDHYDDLEKHMLIQFYDFVKSHQGALWIHWNMSNINYGFEAIAHRYKVLSGTDAPQVPDSRRFNLSTLILAIYGGNCVNNPRMVNLMQLNGGRPRDQLTGPEEVEAFRNKEYIKLHKSTISKVYWFQSMYSKLQARKIRTTHTNFWNRINEFMENPAAKLLSFVSVLYTLFQLTQAAYIGFPLPQQNNVKLSNPVVQGDLHDKTARSP